MIHRDNAESAVRSAREASVRPALVMAATTIAATAAIAIGHAAAQEPALTAPLEITVHPSGFEAGPAGPAGETLDEKLARRDRSFRFICIGCVRVDGRVADAPFRPIETLNASQLTAALAVRPQPVEAAPE